MSELKPIPQIHWPDAGTDAARRATGLATRVNDVCARTQMRPESMSALVLAARATGVGHHLAAGDLDPYLLSASWLTSQRLDQSSASLAVAVLTWISPDPRAAGLITRPGDVKPNQALLEIMQHAMR